MKSLFIFLVLAFSTTASYASSVTLTGLTAKAVYDALTSNDELSVFSDGGMGKRYVTMGSIKCYKSTVSEKEIMACTFKSPANQEAQTVTLTSEKNFETVGDIRFVLAQATGAEIQVNAERKVLKIKDLSCKTSGYGHVLDSNEIEVQYDCLISY